MAARQIQKFMVLYLWGMLLFCRCLIADSPQMLSKSVQGGIHLSQWNFETQGPLPLDGEWEFYWKQLLTPRDFSQNQPPTKTGWIEVPQKWDDYEYNDQSLGPLGYATFRTTLIPSAPSHERVALYIDKLDTAYQLWLDGRLVAKNGSVGTDAEQSIPWWEKEIVTFDLQTQPIELVIQISNYHFKRGGFRNSILLGTEQQILEKKEQNLRREYILFGGLMIMGFYHFSLFLFRRNKPSTLYFGALCILTVSRISVTGERLLIKLFPVPWEWAVRLEYFSFYLAPALFFALLYSLYPKEVWKGIVPLATTVGSLFALMSFVTPVDFFSRTVHIYQFLILGGALYVTWILSLSLRRRREGSGLFMGGWGILFLGIIADILHTYDVVSNGNWTPIGLFIFIFFQSVVLSKRFSKAFSNIEILSDTFRKFVPNQFIERIGHDGIESIKLGNVKREYVTILFCDIRSFTTLSESMSPNEVFQFLNAYMSRLEPPIQENGGFVDKFIGDAVMALFDQNDKSIAAQSAVNAALGMQKALKAFNQERSQEGLSPIRAGIGIHSGNVMIGTVGSSERMDSTAIGDTVNLTSRIEEMTKHYGASLLISEETFSHLGDSSNYLIRMVARVVVRGKTQPVTVFEIFNEDPPELRDKKIQTKSRFEEGVLFFTQKQFQEAKTVMEEHLLRFPDDFIARIYLQQCLEVRESAEGSLLKTTPMFNAN